MQRPREVSLRHSSCEADEQSRTTGCGAGGAKAGDQGERGSAKHHRAQSRVRVTQALDRVRQAARQRKKEQFTALTSMSIRSGTAFYALKRKAAPGVDGVTWEDYEADLEPRARGPARSGPSRSLPGRSSLVDIHTKVGGEAKE